MTPVGLLLEKLSNAKCNPKRNGKGWVARCPAHDDRRPSLSISEGKGARALVHCHAGCAPERIVAALGLTLADLMPPNDHDPPQQKRPQAGEPRGDTMVNRVYPTCNAAVKSVEKIRGPRAALWTYHNAGEEPVGAVVRWDTPEGKRILPVSKTRTGWIIGAMSEPRPLYRLPDLLGRPNEPVYVVEGEKCADAMASLGLLSTTSAGGADAAEKSNWTPLAGREVVILPDNDRAGERYAGDVAAILAKLTPPATVRIVNLLDAWPDLLVGEDIADVVERVKDADAIKAKLDALVDKAEPEPQPQPQPAPAVEPYRPFPTDALPQVAAGFVDEGAKALGCDPAYIALPLLAELASAIGNSRRIRLKAAWSEPPVLWTVVVGDSGTLKSPAFDLALRPIRLRQKQAMKEYKQAEAEYRDAKEQYDEAVKAWRKAKPEDRGNRPEEPEAPVCERLWCSDTTVEALADRLSNAPRGLLVARDELAGWLASFNQYKAGHGGDVAHWLEMHRAGPLLVDRKTGDKTTIYVPRASICIAGGIQPETLRRCLTPEFYDNGLAARLLLAMPPKRVKRWTEADLDGNTMDAMGRLFAELLGFQPSTNLDGEPEPADVVLTEPAKALWVAFYNAHAQEQAELSGELSAAWSKLEGYAARLALVVHCVRQASGEAVDPWRCDEQSMASGIALADWFGHEAKRVYAILGESDEERDARRLVEWIERKGGSVTVRDVTRGVRTYRGNTDSAEAALDALAEAGLGRWEDDTHGPKGGRPARRFRLVTSVTVDASTVDTTGKNQWKSGGSVDSRHVDTHPNGGSVDSRHVDTHPNGEAESALNSQHVNTAERAWLRELLRAGPMEVAKIKDEAKAAGYAWRTVRLAKDELGIRTDRDRFGANWTWRLPETAAALSCHVPSTQPPEIDPPAPTKPPFSIAPRGFVDVGAVDARDTDGGDWGEV
jgi:hypothetical protein